MGRVSRFKKIKQCDPFAKKRPVVVDPKYDQPPPADEGGDAFDLAGDGIDDFTDAAGWTESAPTPRAASEPSAAAVAAAALAATAVIAATAAARTGSGAAEGALSKRSLKRQRLLAAATETPASQMTQAQHAFQEDLRMSKMINRISRDGTGVKKVRPPGFLASIFASCLA